MLRVLAVCMLCIYNTVWNNLRDACAEDDIRVLVYYTFEFDVHHFVLCQNKFGLAIGTMLCHALCSMILRTLFI